MPGKAKILLMDDEQIILDMTRDVLDFLNYDVMFAKEGSKAIDLYKQEKAAGFPSISLSLTCRLPADWGVKRRLNSSGNTILT